MGTRDTSAFWSFGRERETQHARESHKKPESAKNAVLVVEAVHDLVDGRIDIPEARSVLLEAMAHGPSGVWESVDSWLTKLTPIFPELESIWGELARDASAKVRWRAACVLDSMPPTVAQELGDLLAADRGEKVREYAKEWLKNSGGQPPPTNEEESLVAGVLKFAQEVNQWEAQMNAASRLRNGQFVRDETAKEAIQGKSYEEVHAQYDAIVSRFCTQKERKLRNDSWSRKGRFLGADLNSVLGVEVKGRDAEVKIRCGELDHQVFVFILQQKDTWRIDRLKSGFTYGDDWESDAI